MVQLREKLQTALGPAYTLERELGGGGMSHVFLAMDNALRRQVVVKVLPPDMLEGVSVERFRREIQLAASLQHPHIVPVISAGEARGMPYYTMPFVTGLSLRERLHEIGRLDIDEAIGVLREVAKALAYAHEHGVVHRDIKPENVLITGDTAAVTDFGIAKALSASRSGVKQHTLTTAGVPIGTPEYMSPEQAGGDPNVDHRADIYAFGCLAYEVLTGAPPFTAPLTHRVLAAHIRETPQPVTAQRRDAPPTLAALVMRCLEKNPSERPQHASEIVRILASASTPTTSGIGKTRAIPEPETRRPTPVRYLVVLSAVALALLLLLRWYY